MQLTIISELNGHHIQRFVCIWNKAASGSQTAWHRCKHEQSVEAHFAGCVSEAVCRALRSRGLFYVAVCPVYVLLPLLCALH